MSISDYAHWNEDAPRIWWEEVGKHAESDAEQCREDMLAEEDAYADELADMDDDELLALRADQAYIDRWPKAAKLLDWEIKERGIGQ